MSADTLTTLSREFYENTKIKVSISLTFAGIGLLLLGFAAVDGGQAQAANLSKDNTNVGWIEDYLDAEASGFGFSCFVKLIGAFIAFIVSIYFSPVFCGLVSFSTSLSTSFFIWVIFVSLFFRSLNEKKTLRTPLEVEQVYPEYSSSHERPISESNPAANQA